MDYKTYKPHPDLSSLINFYWTLEVPEDINAKKQRIIPDGCIEMAFILGDDIMRYTSETDYIIQPRAMILGQTMDAFYIQPTGYVHTFSVSFYPYGFANFVAEPIKNLVNKETPLNLVFNQEAANRLQEDIINANDTPARISIIEEFLFQQLADKDTVSNIVLTTIDTLLSTNGNIKINDILKKDPSKRRQLERSFHKQIGISPKQLAKVIRLQAALKVLLNNDADKLTDIAYDINYYDQSHFIKDFKEFTGISPRDFLEDETMALSSIFYK